MSRLDWWFAASLRWRVMVSIVAAGMLASIVLPGPWAWLGLVVAGAAVGVLAESIPARLLGVSVAATDAAKFAELDPVQSEAIRRLISPAQLIGLLVLGWALGKRPEKEPAEQVSA